MRITLTFHLPEEEYDLRMAMHGADYHRALHEVMTILRNVDKYDLAKTPKELYHEAMGCTEGLWPE